MSLSNNKLQYNYKFQAYIVSVILDIPLPYQARSFPYIIKIGVLLMNILKHCKYDGNGHFVILHLYRYCVINIKKMS